MFVQATLGLAALRKQIGVVPQDPARARVHVQHTAHSTDHT